MHRAFGERQTQEIDPVEEVVRSDTFILGTQRTASDEEPATDAIHKIGKLARARVPGQRLRFVVALETLDVVDPQLDPLLEDVNQRRL